MSRRVRAAGYLPPRGGGHHRPSVHPSIHHRRSILVSARVTLQPQRIGRRAQSASLPSPPSPIAGHPTAIIPEHDSTGPSRGLSAPPRRWPSIFVNIGVVVLPALHQARNPPHQWGLTIRIGTPGIYPYNQANHWTSHISGSVDLQGTGGPGPPHRIVLAH